MFKNHTVLFVGYGLAELEVLDHIIRSNESLRTGTAEPRHFLLYAHRSTESVQTRFIKHFFRDQCGVCVVQYCIDAKGHQEVVEVFKSWKSELMYETRRRWTFSRTSIGASLHLLQPIE